LAHLIGITEAKRVNVIPQTPIGMVMVGKGFVGYAAESSDLFRGSSGFVMYLGLNTR